MPNGTYGGVRGRKTKVGRKLLRFPPTRLMDVYFKVPFLIPINLLFSIFVNVISDIGVCPVILRKGT